MDRAERTKKHAEKRAAEVVARARDSAYQKSRRHAASASGGGGGGGGEGGGGVVDFVIDDDAPQDGDIEDGGASVVGPSPYASIPQPRGRQGRAVIVDSFTSPSVLRLPSALGGNGDATDPFRARQRLETGRRSISHDGRSVRRAPIARGALLAPINPVLGNNRGLLRFPCTPGAPVGPPHMAPTGRSATPSLASTPLSPARRVPAAGIFTAALRRPPSFFTATPPVVLFNKINFLFLPSHEPAKRRRTDKHTKLGACQTVGTCEQICGLPAHLLSFV